MLKNQPLIRINNELIEHIEISQNIIDRKSLNLVITGSEVLDELEIEYTDLNAMLGMKGERYTRAERAVMKDNQLTDSDAIERSEERRVGKECRSRWAM